MALLTLKFVTDVRDMDYEVVEFHGELDQSNLIQTEKQIGDLLKDFTRKFMVFDLSDLGFINSEGIGFMVSISTKLARKESKLLLTGVRANVADIFNLIGLPKLIPVVPTIADAIRLMKTGE